MGPDPLHSLFSPAGRRAVVTGASSGIGRHLALLLARLGAEVLVVARRADRLEQLAEAEPALAPRLHACPADLADPEAPARVAAAAERLLGGCDLLIGAAGMPGRGGVVHFDAAQFTRVLQLNVTSQAALASALHPLLRRSSAGRVIHVASIYGLRGEETGPLAAYVASKHALVGLTRSQALEWAADGISVNAIAPAHFPTEMTEALLANPELGPRLLSRYPQGRFGRLEELDTTVLWLASPATSFITGVVVPIDGGWTAR